MCLLSLSTACSTTERVIRKAEIVEITDTVYVNVPADLTAPIPKQERPDGDVTFGDLIDLLGEERATVDELNGRLKAVESLGKENE